jgi:mono/diheme cytochrome c family protein
MRHIALAALLTVPLVTGCVKANPPTDTGDPIVTTPTSPTSPTSPTAPTTPTTPTTGDTTALAYNPDVKALMQSDCVICHGPSRADGNFRAATYAQVMTAVRAGSASSKLVTVTQSNGSMYRYWSGSTATRQSKAAAVRSWVVTYNAQENR